MLKSIINLGKSYKISSLPPPPDQWNEEYISFLLDTIESPPEQDTDEQLPDAFLNVLLSFNQHFSGEPSGCGRWAGLTVGVALADPETNPVMNVLKTKKDPRHFSEKLMFLINRGGMYYGIII